MEASLFLGAERATLNWRFYHNSFHKPSQIFPCLLIVCGVSVGWMRGVFIFHVRHFSQDFRGELHFRSQPKLFDSSFYAGWNSAVYVFITDRA